MKLAIIVYLLNKLQNLAFYYKKAS